MLKKIVFFFVLCSGLLTQNNLDAISFRIVAVDNQSTSQILLTYKRVDGAPTDGPWQFLARQITYTPPLYNFVLPSCRLAATNLLVFVDNDEPQRPCTSLELPSTIKFYLDCQKLYQQTFSREEIAQDSIITLVLVIDTHRQISIVPYDRAYQARVNDRFPLAFYPREQFAAVAAVKDNDGRC